MIRGIETETPEYVRVQHCADIEVLRKRVSNAQDSVNKATEALCTAARLGRLTEAATDRLAACVKYLLATIAELEHERSKTPARAALSSGESTALRPASEHDTALARIPRDCGRPEWRKRLSAGVILP